MSKKHFFAGIGIIVLIFASSVASAKADATMWTQTYGGVSADRGFSVVETSDGGYAIAGFTDSFGAGSADVWLAKTDEYGVVPEATWVVLPLLAIATVSIFISKKKLIRQCS